MSIIRGCLLIFLCVLIVFLIFLYYLYYQLSNRYSLINANYSGIEILGENVVDNNFDEFAEEMWREAENIWSVERNGNDWFLEDASHDSLVIESRPVIGPFKMSSIPVQRAFACLTLPADGRYNSPLNFYQFMISPQGFAIIDPITNISEHEKPPYQQFPWKKPGKGRLEIVQVGADLFPPFRKREFVVFNAFKELTRTFVSKSVKIEALGVNGTVRAINTFALQFEAALPRTGKPAFHPHLGKCTTKTADGGGNECTSSDGSKECINTEGESNYSGGKLVLMKSYNYLDLAVDPLINYFINADTFYPQLLNRINAHLAIP